ncbi:MAG: prenyltransferase/squalene oxidase repeat-containing protein [Pirellulales bacterium]
MATSGPTVGSAAGESGQPVLWLNGDVLSCACPDCGAPMSIRLWLMVADCWACGTGIELTEEQEEQARRLLEGRRAAPEPASRPTPPPAPPPRPAPAPARVAPAPVSVPEPVVAAPSWDHVVARQSSPDQAVLLATTRLWRRELFTDLPAWLISLIVHLIAMILLGLWTVNPEEDRQITLSVRIGPSDREGAFRGEEQPKATEFERPGVPDAPDPPPTDPAEIEAARDAAELVTGPADPPGNRPERSEVVRALATAGRARMFEGRDPRVRAQVVEQEGGTTFTEAAVARGLRWIARHQNENGSWSLHSFQFAGDCDGQCGGQGDFSDTAGTALALLPFLGAGQTHEHGRYQKEVAGGLRWLIRKQRENGDLRGEGVGRMYAHGQAAIVLCEAYALTQDEQLREPAQAAIDFIVDAQHEAGGWRYSPGEPGDTSVLGWQLMALRSGRMAGLRVPTETMLAANRFLDDVQYDRDGALYCYQVGREPTPAMTAEALLCRQYLGWPRKHKGLQLGIVYLLSDHLPSRDDANIYYWYYATQVLHHYGGKPWQFWNERQRALLVEMQETEGHEAGSWSPAGGAPGTHDVQSGGRLYMTSLAVCCLEVYYRHLPIYRSVEVE